MKTYRHLFEVAPGVALPCSIITNVEYTPWWQRWFLKLFGMTYYIEILNLSGKLDRMWVSKTNVILRCGSTQK